MKITSEYICYCKLKLTLSICKYIHLFKSPEVTCEKILGISLSLILWLSERHWFKKKKKNLQFEHLSIFCIFKNIGSMELCYLLGELWLRKEWYRLTSVSYLLSISVVKQLLWLIYSTKCLETSDTKRVDENCCTTMPKSTAIPGVFLFLHELNLYMHTILYIHVEYLNF